MSRFQLHRARAAATSAAFLLSLAISPQGAPASGALTFEQDIRPIFRTHCYDCHGASSELKGGLDLRLVRLMIQGGKSGTALVPGQPEESHLLQRIHKGEMPPNESRVPAAEIEILRRWIAAGAPTARPEPETIAPGLGITPEDRAFWSFQPIKRPAVPSPADASRIRNPIDAFIRQAMPPPLQFAHDAGRPTLVRRAFFDLIGLPPSPEEMSRWIADPGEDWYDRLLSELLDSPHYGELWARHWLDVAGYADSEGSTIADTVRSWAWKYRDWVIRSLNEDKPFDQFIVEQLAGDELAGPREGDLTPTQIELLTATGFLRMAADGTGSGANTPAGRNQVMTDTLKIIGTSLLSVSLQCAQCHDHRYDPIPQTDYFSLRAVFEPALDWQKWQTPQQRLVSLYTAEDRKRAAEIEAEAQVVAVEKKQKQDEYMAQALEKELGRYEEPLRAQLHDAYTTPGDKRSPEQKALLDQHPSVNITTGNLYQYIPKSQEDLAGYDKRIAEVRARKPAEEFIRALIEPDHHVPETKLFHRGDHEQPRETILPAALSVVTPPDQPARFTPDDPGLNTTGRRLQFARWLTRSPQPLMARSIVNRVWMHHFGRGIVSTPSDFGRLGATPTHPELLDWLAGEFVSGGWSLKKLHRLILSSTTWRQASRIEAGPQRDAALALDPTVRFYWRKPLIRLEAELIRDRMLAASGRLDPQLFGPPLAIKEDDAGQVMVDGEQTRRSLYIQSRRSRPVGMLQSFDAPVMETNCENRPNSTAATQSLMLLNGTFTLDQAAQLAERAAREAGPLPPGLGTAETALPAQPPPIWNFGYGRYDTGSQRTSDFTPLPHWTGSAWQGGPTLPDPNLGWALLTATGGHPDIEARSIIRRWIAPADGQIRLDGSLQHTSENGNGIRGRIVSSRSGLIGEWSAHHQTTPTPSQPLTVLQGDTIDFITDANGSHESDSFNWPCTLTLTTGEREEKTFSTDTGFHGPVASTESLPAQVVRAWQLAFSREPAPAEFQLALAFLSRQLHAMSANPAAVPSGKTPPQQAMANLCQSLLGSNEFLYID